MSLQYKVIGALVALIVAFGVGRYSATSQQSAVKTITDVKTDTDTKVNKDVKKTITETKKPDGEVTTVTTEEAVTVVDQQKDQVSHQSATVIPPKTNTLNLSALVGINPVDGLTPLYGLSVSKQFIGPITGGIWGLTNGTFGVSVGINF